jgi:dihydroorotate dehydrogenase
MFNFTQPIYPILLSAFKDNPEEGHQQLLKTLNWVSISRNHFYGEWIEKQLQQSFCYCDPLLEQRLWGLNFKNPLGLAAGFDKNGIGAGIWHSLGFGFAELGAVTLHPQIGNPQPRLFRLPLDRAALNRMGANNLGAEVMAKTLHSAWQTQPRQIPIGINLCKSKITPIEEAAADYVGSFKLLQDWADYFVVNVSSPNTPGLRSLQAGEQLELILAALELENRTQKPILVKISPDLEWFAITDILSLAKTYNLAGIVATNTTIAREGLKTKIIKTTKKPLEQEAGGISGQPLAKRSTEIISFIWEQTQGQLPIIGVGGIFTVEDAWEKITAGASLLQIYTGWVYEGPWVVRRILEGLKHKLEANKLLNISEAVALKHRS